MLAAGWRGLSIPTAAHVDGGATGRRCCRIFAGFDSVIEKWQMVKVGGFMIVWKMLRQLEPHSKIRHIAEKV